MTVEPDITKETYVIHNKDGSVSLDPYAKMTREELKIKCGQMSRHLHRWQMIACHLQLQEQVPEDDMRMVLDLIEAYND